MKKRIFASLLSLCLIVGLLSMSVLAAENEAPDNEPPVICTMNESCGGQIHDKDCPLYTGTKDVPADDIEKPLIDEQEEAAPADLTESEPNDTDNDAVIEPLYPVKQTDVGEPKNLYINGVALIEDGTLTSNVVQGVSYSNKVLYLENAEIDSSHLFETEPGTNKTAAIYADGPLTISLQGSNHINISSDSELDFAVYSTEELSITGTGDISISGVIDAFSAKTIGVENTGELTIACANGGLMARQGNLSIQKSSLTINTANTAWGTAVNTASGDFSMESGSLTIDMPKGDPGYYTYGLYITGDVNISGGTIDIEAQQDSIYCRGNCTILDGNITVPDGIRAQSDGTLTIKNGSVSVGGRGFEAIGDIYLLGGKIIFSGNKILSDNTIFVDNVNWELDESTKKLNLEGTTFVLNRLGDISYQLWCAKDTYEEASKRIAFIGGAPNEGQISFFTGESGKKTYVVGCIANLQGGIIPANAQITAKELSSPVKDGRIFEGWYTQNGTDTDNWGEKVIEVTAGQTYYAKWIELKTDTISMEYGSVSSAFPSLEGVTLSNWQSGDTSIVSVEGNKLKANKVGTTTLTATATTEAGGSATLTVDVEVTPMPITFGNGKGENPSGTVDHVYDGMAPDYFDYAAFYPATVEDGKVSIVPGSQEVALEAGNDLVFVYDDGSGSGAQDHDSLPVNVTDSEGMNVTVKLLNPNYRFVTDTNTTLSETVSVTVKIHADNMDKQDLYINGEKVDVITDAFVKTYNGQGQAPVADLTTVRSDGIDTFTVHFHPLNSNTDFEETHLTGTASNLTAEAVLKKAPKEPGQYLMIVNGLKEGTGTERGRYAYASAVFSIEKATVTIRPNDKTICVGDALPELGADDYTVTGLAPGDSLTALPTLAYDGTPDTTKEGNYAIKASGAAVDEEHYTLKYEDGVLTISLSSGNTDPDDPGNSDNTGDSGNTDKTDKTDKSDSLSNSPHTGDMGNITVWTALFTLSIIAAAAAFLRKKIR